MLKPPPLDGQAATPVKLKDFVETVDAFPLPSHVQEAVVKSIEAAEMRVPEHLVGLSSESVEKLGNALDPAAQALLKRAVAKAVEDATGLGVNSVGTESNFSLWQMSKSPRDGKRLSNAQAAFTADGYVQVPLSRAESTQRRIHSPFWSQQCQCRPRRVVLVRHGESEANVQRNITKFVPDHDLHLTQNGRQQALAAGVRLKGIIGDEKVRFIVSPYVRTRETLNGIMHAWGEERAGLHVREDVRLREMEYGNFDSPEIRDQHKEKKKFGPFYYRFPSGESPADCYDRASIFLESLYRSWEDNSHENYVIVCHGTMISVLLMRLFRFEISMFDELEALKNTELIVLERPEDDAKFGITYTWPPDREEKNYGGLRARSQPAAEVPVWNGDPGAPLLQHDGGA